MQLTEHFTAAELGVLDCDARIVEAARDLCVRILEPIRAHFGAPVRVHSGYRDPKHNARVGGKPLSWHLFMHMAGGTQTAVDFDVIGVATDHVFDWMRLHSKLPFDKAILERDRSGRPACMHVQYASGVDSQRRLAYVGSTGAATDYVPVEVNA